MKTDIKVIDENKVTDEEKVVTMIIGGVVGALIGLSAAYLLIKGAEDQDGKVEVSAGEGIKLSLLVMGLLRQVAQLGEGD